MRRTQQDHTYIYIPPTPINQPHLTKNTPSNTFKNTGTGARFFYMATVSVGGGRKYAHIPFTVLASGFMGEQKEGWIDPMRANNYKNVMWTPCFTPYHPCPLLP